MTSPRITYEDDRVALWEGRWEDVIDQLPTVDAVITDPPYSERTHAGSDAAVNRSNDDAYRREIGYSFWDAEDVHAAASAWAERCAGWIVPMTDDVLTPAWRASWRAVGRYDFAPVSVLIHKPRLSGDGPGSCTVHVPPSCPAEWFDGAVRYVVPSRPRQKRFLGWGSLPGWYEANPARGAVVQGAKELSLMRALVRDYSRPGDLILDPCAGGATTLLAARLEGRRAIGCEMDPETCAKAATLLKHGRVALKNPAQETLDL